jgi:hypothetical protein
MYIVGILRQVFVLLVSIVSQFKIGLVPEHSSIPSAIGSTTRRRIDKSDQSK